MSANCQYCFFTYESCTCCKYCSFPKNTCDCHLEGENPCTKLHPSDIYKTFLTKPDLCEGFMGIKTIEDCDKFIMSMYSKDCWPERLK